MKLSEQQTTDLINFVKPLANLLGSDYNMPVFYAEDDEIEALGLVYDGGESLGNLYQISVGDVEALREKLDEIDDIDALGSAIYTAYRWVSASGAIGGDISEESEWLRLACLRMVELLESRTNGQGAGSAQARTQAQTAQAAQPQAQPRRGPNPNASPTQTRPSPSRFALHQTCVRRLALVRAL